MEKFSTKEFLRAISQTVSISNFHLSSNVVMAVKSQWSFHAILGAHVHVRYETSTITCLSSVPRTIHTSHTDEANVTRRTIHDYKGYTKWANNLPRFLHYIPSPLKQSTFWKAQGRGGIPPCYVQVVWENLCYQEHLKPTTGTSSSECCPEM